MNLNTSDSSTSSHIRTICFDTCTRNNTGNGTFELHLWELVGVWGGVF